MVILNRPDLKRNLEILVWSLEIEYLKPLVFGYAMEKAM